MCLFHSSTQQPLIKHDFHPSTVLGEGMMTHTGIAPLLLVVSGGQIFLIKYADCQAPNTAQSFYNQLFTSQVRGSWAA